MLFCVALPNISGAAFLSGKVRAARLLVPLPSRRNESRRQRPILVRSEWRLESGKRIVMSGECEMSSDPWHFARSLNAQPSTSNPRPQLLTLDPQPLARSPPIPTRLVRSLDLARLPVGLGARPTAVPRWFADRRALCTGVFGGANR